MIKYIINKIKSLFIPKQQMDEHAEYYLKEKKSDILVIENENSIKPKHCSGHLRFRKSCPRCQEIVK